MSEAEHITYTGDAILGHVIENPDRSTYYYTVDGKMFGNTPDKNFHKITQSAVGKYSFEDGVELEYTDQNELILVKMPKGWKFGGYCPNSVPCKR